MNIKSHLSLVTGLSVYFVLCAILYPSYFYSLSPDGISYISVADKYLHLDPNSINAYWSPLLSWLLIPVLAFIRDGMIAFKVLTMIIGALTIFSSYLLIQIFNISTFQKAIFTFTVAIMAFYFSLSTSPDLLLVLIYLIYLYLITSPSYLTHKQSGVLAGILGGLMYLTKSFGLPFFLSHFVLTNIIYLLRKSDAQTKKIIRINFFSGIVFALLIVTPWALIITDKQGHFTISESSTYNYSVITPGNEGAPMNKMGLLSPPNDTAISVWEDISSVDLEMWNFFGSKENIIHLVKYIADNTFELLQTLQDFSMLSISILLMALFYLFNRQWDAINSRTLTILTSLGVLFLGYALVLVLDRYIWMASIVLFAMAMSMTTVYRERFQIKNATYVLMVLTISWTFLQYPLKMSIHKMDINAFIGEIDKQLTPLQISGKIASNTEWDETLLLSYLQGWKYLGRPPENASEPAIAKTLAENNIDYYLMWESANNPGTPPAGFTLFTAVNIENVSNTELMPHNTLKVYASMEKSSAARSTRQ